MRIGDLFLRILPDDKGFQANVVKSGAKAGDAAGKSLGSRLKAAMSPQNLAISAGVGLAFAKALSFVDDAVNAAREENAAIATLTQSVKANDAAWDGNIERIEKVIEARQDLAFSDDEQRASLQRLVSVTKDVDKALELQATAMDLARLRGMDLATASELIGKVYAGNLGILSRYGIVLKKGTTATEALAEIQRRAAGQAETYAETELGLSERLQIAVDNRVEDIGRKLLPAVAEFTQFLLDHGIPALDTFIALLDFDSQNSADDIPILGELEDILNFIPQQGLLLGDQLRGMQTDIERAADSIGMDYLEFRAKVKAVMDALGVDHKIAIDKVLANLARIEDAEAHPYADYAQRAAAALRGGNLPGVAGEVAGGVEGAFADTGDDIAGPFEDGTDQAVEAVRNMYAVMAAVIAERENELRQAGGDAVEAWLDPQLLRNQATIVQGELEQANADLLTAQQEGTDAEVAEAENRVLELTGEAQELQQSLALIGTDMEQAAALSALRTSDFMLAGLTSEDEGIRRAFEAWDAELAANIEHMENEAETGGQRIPALIETGVRGGTPSAGVAADALANAISNPITQLNSYPWGFAFGSDIAAGMWDSKQLISDAAYALANAMARDPRVESEADPHSPLYGHMKWGYNFGKDIADGIREAIPEVYGASLGLAGAAALHGGRMAMAGPVGYGMAGPGAGGGDTNLNLVVDGERRRMRSADDLWRGWTSMSPFAD